VLFEEEVGSLPAETQGERASSLPMSLAQSTFGFLAFAHAEAGAGWLSLSRHNHVPEEPTEQTQADERLG
jgi:hypothetical protein